MENNNSNNSFNTTNSNQQSEPQPQVEPSSASGNMAMQSYTIKDYGPMPVVFDMETITKMNKNFRTTLWTGKYMQITLMSIEPGEDIGAENHPNLDQFVRIEEGDGIFSLGYDKDNLSYNQNIEEEDAIVIPAGAWHNISNTGDIPLKLYSIYAPPEHEYDLVDKTKADADERESEEKK